MGTPRAVRAAILVDAIQGRNGVGTYFHDLLQHLDDADSDVVLFCPKGETPDRYQGWSVPLPGDETQRMYLPRVARLWFALRRLRPQVVVLSTPGPYGILGYLYARTHGVPMCMAFQTDYVRLMKLYWKGPVSALARRFLGILQHAFLRSAVRVMAISEEMFRAAGEQGARNVRLVGTPLAPSFLAPVARPIQTPPKRYLFVGRLAPEKHVERFAAAAAACPDLEFHVAGDGPLRPVIEAACAKSPNLHYHGWCSRESVVAHIDTADVLVLPSKVEAFGTVVMEALCRGRLALVSEHCGVTQWPSFSDSVIVLGDGEPVGEAIARMGSWDIKALETRVEAGLRASRQLNRDTVSHWLGTLESLAPHDAEPAPTRVSRTWGFTTRILSINGWLF